MGILEAQLTPVNTEEKNAAKALARQIEQRHLRLSMASPQLESECIAKKKTYEDEKPKIAPLQDAFDIAKRNLDAKDAEIQTAAQAFTEAYVAKQKISINYYAGAARSIADSITANAQRKVQAENEAIKNSWTTFLTKLVVKTAGVALAVFSAMATAGAVLAVAGNAVPAAVAYAGGVAVPAIAYFIVR
jgi:hypothetical protein